VRSRQVMGECRAAVMSSRRHPTSPPSIERSSELSRPRVATASDRAVPPTTTSVRGSLAPPMRPDPVLATASRRVSSCAALSVCSCAAPWRPACAVPALRPALTQTRAWTSIPRIRHDVSVYTLDGRLVRASASGNYAVLDLTRSYPGVGSMRPARARRRRVRLLAMATSPSDLVSQGATP